MIAADTNIVVRYVTNDDRVQADLAEQTLRSGDVLLIRTVLLETHWVLRKTYGLSPARIAAVLRAVLGLPGISTDDPAAVVRALDWYEAGLDFADALHLASSAAVTEFVTFDKRLGKRAARLGAAPPVKVL